MSQLPDHLHDVPEGWHGLLANLHTKLVFLDEEYDVAQTKEKFGALRVYLSSPETNEIKNAIAEVEWKSEKICEKCGGYGRQQCINGWWRALCEAHGEGSNG